VIKFGTFVPQGWRMDLRDVPDIEQYEVLTRCAQEAEAAGFDSAWVYDHFHTAPPATQPTFEAWTVMAGLARDTHRIRLGQMVACNEYRPPSLLAKMAACVDVMSRGRLVVGLGAGWYQQEFTAYGYDFPTTAERLRRLGEAAQVMRAMWTDERATFDGRYYSIRNAICEPKPLQKPHPPLWIGGGGEQVTLRLVARFGDACNISGDPATLRRKLDVLRRHCEETGRDFGELVKSTNVTVVFGEGAELERDLGRVAEMTGRGLEALRRDSQFVSGSPAEVAERIGRRVAVGFDYVIVFLPLMARGGEIRRFAEEVIPALG
jgi:F420-dependent oxidoreductase-like protein